MMSVAALALLAGAAAAEDSPGNQPSRQAASAQLPQITIEAQRKDTEKRA